jgi:hypothetical protein
MINTAQALHQFWSGFDLPAYTVNTVPDDASLPYITYSLIETEPLQPATHYAQVWYRSTSNAELLNKVDEIKEVIGGCVLVECDGGYVAIRPANPYVQLMVDEDPENRYAYINMQINCYHN